MLKIIIVFLRKSLRKPLVGTQSAGDEWNLRTIAGACSGSFGFLKPHRIAAMNGSLSFLFGRSSHNAASGWLHIGYQFSDILRRALRRQLETGSWRLQNHLFPTFVCLLPFILRSATNYLYFTFDFFKLYLLSFSNLRLRWCKFG